MQFLIKFIFIIGSGTFLVTSAFAHGTVPTPILGAPTPPVPGLLDGDDPIVINKDMAIALGKALFWDTNVGSDGMACGSCHFHAGVDRRTKNQLNPGTLGSLSTNESFDTLASGAGGANHDLTKTDFPLYEYNDPFDKESGVARETDDAVASSGTFSGEFTGASKFSGANDECNRNPDAIHNVHGIGTRLAEPRNAPTMINAVFNYRSFWDGRANNIFNGSSPWGDRDPDAGVWVKKGRRNVEKRPLHLKNSSLASQLAATALSQLEMTCSNRSIADIGRKLLLRAPLQYQKVHHEDSVFAPLGLTLSTESTQKPGLNTTYKTMIRKAFAPKYWSYTRRGKFGSPASGGIAYNQMEANFTMFFALAVQLYETTLVSDQAPIDLTPRDPGSMLPTWEGMGMTEEEIQSVNAGILAFESNHCNGCHAGPLLTTAAITLNSTLTTPTEGAFYGPDHFPIPYGPNALGPGDAAKVSGIGPNASVVTRDATTGGPKLHDQGFATTAVNDPLSDPGLDAVDDFGNPLSFSDQYVEYLKGDNGTLPKSKIKDSDVTAVYSCDFISSLAKNSPFPNRVTFNSTDGIEADGSREGSLKNQNCVNSNHTWIPTVDAANNASDLALKLAVASKAAFKIPILRNIELTGPYMHNGSMATLEQVLEFYGRQGNADNLNKHNLVTNITLANSPQQRTDIIAFLKTLTDDRVRYERAPFDHPEIKVPNGHKGDSNSVTAGNPIDPTLATEDFLVIPASGANGIAEPLQPFDSFLAP